MSEKSTLLVTGASGHLGRRVIELLLEGKSGPIIAASRSPEELANLRQQGVVTRHADFNDPTTLAEAFAGVDRLLLISTDVLGEPGLRLKQHLTAVQAAEAAGVKHVVYTSFINPEPGSAVLFAPDHYGTEQALKDSKMNWTILRNSLYADLLFNSFNQAVQLGGLFSAAGDGKTAYVTREDCARAAAAALTADFYGRRVLDITGPEALSQAELADLFSQIAGKTIPYVPLEVGVLVQNMVKAGLPRPIAETYASIDTAVAQGQFENVSSAFEKLTGDQAATITQFLTAQLETV